MVAAAGLGVHVRGGVEGRLYRQLRRAEAVAWAPSCRTVMTWAGCGRWSQRRAGGTVANGGRRCVGQRVRAGRVTPAYGL
jgi:hypothetical protein